MATPSRHPHPPDGRGDDWSVDAAMEPGPAGLVGVASTVLGEPLFAARHHDRGGAWVLELSGECDIATLDALRTALARAVDMARDRQALIVDVSQLAFCDTRSAVLVMQAGTAVTAALAGAEGIVRRVFDLLDPSCILARADRIDRVPGQRPGPHSPGEL